MISSRVTTTIHVAAIGAAVAAFSYLVFPQYVSVFHASGETLPGLLVAAHRWAILLPVLGVLIVQLVPSHRLWIAAPTAYLIGVTSLAITLYALYRPVLMVTGGNDWHAI